MIWPIKNKYNTILEELKQGCFQVEGETGRTEMGSVHHTE